MPLGRAAAPGVAAPTGPGFLRAAIAARASSRFRRVQVILELGVYGVALAENRRTHPGEDLTTNLVNAEVDGERLTSDEIASFFILLTAAGNETPATPSATAWWY
ncbi:MAG: cytochrome [Mycobacterium sp.]|nr:cytochrome [Mycobacterium sp.]